MSQGTLDLPTTGVYGGLTAAGLINAAHEALASANSGPSAPANATGSAPVEGQLWLDTSTTPPTLRMYDGSGSNWLPIGALDTTNHLWTPPIGGGIGTIASGTTTDLGSLPQPYINITGTTTINGFGSAMPKGTMKVVKFAGILQLTYNGTSMILPTAANITTAAGDTAVVVHEGSGNYRVVSYQRASGNILTTVMTQANIAQSVGLINGTLVASVGSSALTVAIKTLAGNDPSSSDPVYIGFRDVAAGTGDYVLITLTAATSFVISSGSTMGFNSGEASRLWIVGFNDAGTFRIGAVNARSGTSVMALSDHLLAASTAEGGAGAADSAQVIYTGTAVSAKAMRILGYMDWSSGLAAAGTWSNVPTGIQLFGYGVPRPGDTVQVARTDTGALATGTTTIPLDNTTPQNTEGDQYMLQAITPTAAPNVLAVESQWHGSSGASVVLIMALFQDAAVNALTTTYHQLDTGGDRTAMYLKRRLLAGLAVATTLKIRAGGSSAGTTSFNSSSGGAVFNGTMNSYLEVSEIMA